MVEVTVQAGQINIHIGMDDPTEAEMDEGGRAANALTDGEYELNAQLEAALKGFFEDYLGPDEMRRLNLNIDIMD